ncbi:hypothetical protein ACHAXT_003086 [Thalassiosira profunda]
MRRPATIYLLSSLLCCLAPHIMGSFVSENVIPTAAGRGSPRRSKTKLSSSTVATATDAAVAINSVKFLEMLSGTKNTADVRTYTQTTTGQKLPDAEIERASVSSGDSISSSDNGDGSSPWGFFSWIFRRGDSSSSGDELTSSRSSDECVSSSSAPNSPISHHARHETVSEYIGQLWFLPDSKGIQFRETIRVLSMSADGKTAVVECITQYHNGKRWIDCTRLICNFDSVGSKDGESRELSEAGEMVKMRLECEILVWLPLPKAASHAVRKKIGSVFETVALDYFEELAS